MPGYKAEERQAKELGQELRALPGVHHPVFKGKPVNHDPRERFIADFMAERGACNVFQAFTANWRRRSTTRVPRPTLASTSTR